jgi:type II secretory pathway pseudopilin PulG
VSPAMPGKCTREKRDGAYFCAVPFYSSFADKNSNAGYSLVELIIMIMLVGLIYPVLLGFITSALDNALRGEMINRAIFLAHEKMESISADKRENGFSISQAGQYPEETIDQFRRTVSVQSVIRGGTDGLEVIIWVSCPDMTINYSLTHFFSEYYEY